MVSQQIMVIAGEPSGDTLAAELVAAIRSTPPWSRAEGAPAFFGAAGPKCASAGVEIAFDLTAHAVVGILGVLRKIRFFRAALQQLLRLAVSRQPHLILFVDSSGFNLRLAQALRRHVQAQRGTFRNWNPRLVYFVSPQVWASRPGRVRAMQRDLDLVLSILPFEKDWYAHRAPGLRVEFVGHPLLDRYAGIASAPSDSDYPGASNLVLLLPGSRAAELQRHLPVMIQAAQFLEQRKSVRYRMILPRADLMVYAQPFLSSLFNFEIQIGNLAAALARADLAIASTGTVTLECAYFSVPTIALYKTSWLEYQIGKRIVTVPFLALPNVLAASEVFPEYIQNAADPEILANAAYNLLNDPQLRHEIKAHLRQIIASLGDRGACARAAQHIASLH